MRRLLTAGIFGTILGIVGAGTVNASIVSSGFLDEKLTEYALSTSLDLKAIQSDLTALSNKIGTLPSGEIGGYGPPVNEMLQDYFYQYPKDLAGIYGVLFGTEENIGVLERFATSTLFGVPNSFSGLSSIGIVPDGKNLVGMISETDAKIGTLPSGEILPSKGLAFLLPEPPNSTYPTSIRDFMTDIYTGYWGIANVADAVYFGNEYASQKDPALVVKGLRQITDEIGTLPSGNFPDFPGLEVLSSINLPLTYPTSLAELITAIYGNSETGAQGLLEGIINGFPSDTNGDGLADSAGVGLIPNYMLANHAGLKSNENATKIDSIETKIGDLPTEYATVGAALTAIKGIAEDAKAAALAAIPDPKQEGSSGKFVLTVDIVGDNATYHWEKIDREGETTTTE